MLLCASISLYVCGSNYRTQCIHRPRLCDRVRAALPSDLSLAFRARAAAAVHSRGLPSPCIFKVDVSSIRSLFFIDDVTSERLFDENVKRTQPTAKLISFTLWLRSNEQSNAANSAYKAPLCHRAHTKCALNSNIFSRTNRSFLP